MMRPLSKMLSDTRWACIALQYVFIVFNAAISSKKSFKSIISTGNKGVMERFWNIFVKLYPAGFLILAITITLFTGCLQNDAPGTIDKETTKPAISGLSIPGRAPIDLDFQSEIKGKIFRTWGRLFVNSSEPYLLLNASLIQEGRLVERARLLMIDVQPAPQNFEISEFVRLPSSRDYRCLLTVTSSAGLLASAERACQVEDISRSQQYFTGEVSGPEAAGMADEADIERTYSEEAAFSEDKRVSEDSGSVASGEESASVESISSVPQTEDERSVSASIDSDIAAPSGMSYVASKTSTKYHLPSCRYAEQIKSDKRVWFASEEDARRRGYTPCKVCNP